MQRFTRFRRCHHRSLVFLIGDNKFNLLIIMTHLPSNLILKKAGIELDNKGNVKINQEQQTNFNGVFAAGDVTGGLYQVVFATAQGARAGINANKYIRQLKKS